MEKADTQERIPAIGIKGCLIFLFFAYPFYMRIEEYKKVDTKEKSILRRLRIIKRGGSILMGLFTAMLLYQIYVETHFAIYDTALRFHVRAASDTRSEQALKYKVRDGVLAVLKEAADSADSAWELKEDIRGNMQIVARTAASILRQNGSENRVCVSLTRERFPMRRYGKVWFPAGEYEALRVDIGQAQGHNWWCAIYPELCYNAEESTTLSEKGEADMERDLSEKEREVLCGEKGRFRVKILEWFSKLVQ